MIQEESTQSYYAHGKLLLSGEYLVLSGARALALPLKFGQSLVIQPAQSGFFRWKAHNTSGHWFETEFDDQLNIVHSNNTRLAQSLSSIIKACISYRDDIKDLISNTEAITNLEFNPDWGWGSSSTLISLLSQWLGVNPYLLLSETFGGSGYDIACATSNSAITYQLINNAPKIESVNFNPEFSDNMYFVYSGSKQSSKNEIARFSKLNVSESAIEQINCLTNDMLNSKELKDFGKLMEQHESIISKIVQLKPIKNEHFEDFKGYIKTLGAWGGDFIMVISEEPANYVKTYFEEKGLKHLFNFNDIKIN
ncbi:GYDIA family GHMP kinase [Carboxylicivirga sp. RSCT41]|uniref:GYDIA family GHMP kinase n=1 Tax=Carboxylicivirga agarovorans TaxID=3417570 RepID=UPI003D3443D4